MKEYLLVLCILINSQEVLAPITLTKAGYYGLWYLGASLVVGIGFTVPFIIDDWDADQCCNTSMSINGTEITTLAKIKCQDCIPRTFSGFNNYLRFYIVYVSLAFGPQAVYWVSGFMIYLKNKYGIFRHSGSSPA